MAMEPVGVAEVACGQGVGVALDAVDLEGAAAAFGFGLGWDLGFGGGLVGGGHVISFSQGVQSFTSVQRSAFRKPGAGTGKRKSPTGEVRLFLIFLSKFRISDWEEKTANFVGGFRGMRCGRDWSYGRSYFRQD
jgi:hypothetical protein